MEKQIISEIVRIKQLMNLKNQNSNLISEQVPGGTIKKVLAGSKDYLDDLINLFKNEADEALDDATKIATKTKKDDSAYSLAQEIENAKREGREISDEVYEKIGELSNKKSVATLLRAKNLLGTEFNKIENEMVKSIQTQLSKTKLDENNIDYIVDNIYKKKLDNVEFLKDSPEIKDELIETFRDRIKTEFDGKFTTNLEKEIENIVTQNIPPIVPTNEGLETLRKKASKDITLNEIIFGDASNFLMTFWKNYIKNKFSPIVKKIEKDKNTIEEFIQKSGNLGESKVLDKQLKELVNDIISLRRDMSDDVITDVRKHVLDNQKLPFDIRQKIGKNQLLKEQFDLMAKEKRDILFRPFKDYFSGFVKMIPMLEKGLYKTGDWFLTPLLRILNYITLKDPRTLREMAITVAARGPKQTLYGKLYMYIVFQHIIIPSLYGFIMQVKRGGERQKIQAINFLRKMAGQEPISVPPVPSSKEFWLDFQAALPMDYQGLFTGNGIKGDNPILTSALFWTYWDEIFRYFVPVYNQAAYGDLDEKTLEEMRNKMLNILEEKNIPYDESLTPEQNFDNFLKNTKNKIDDKKDNTTEKLKDLEKQFKEKGKEFAFNIWGETQNPPVSYKGLGEKGLVIGSDGKKYDWVGTKFYEY